MTDTPRGKEEIGSWQHCLALMHALGCQCKPQGHLGGIIAGTKACELLRQRIRDELGREVDALRLAQCHHGWLGNSPKEGERIMTPCPSCGTHTIFIGDGGHLTCSMLQPCCKEPSIERQIAALREQVGMLERANVALKECAQVNEQDATLCAHLIALLSNHCGERGHSEGAVDTLKRIIEEREAAERRLEEGHAWKCGCEPHKDGSVYTDPLCKTLRAGRTKP